MSNLGLGLVAGAAGTLALDVATYLDMAIRGRASSAVPSNLAGELMDTIGVNLGRGEPAENRRSGIGALLGYATGVGMGVAYGRLRPRLEQLPMPVSAVLVGLSTMAVSDVAATAYDVTDPADWGIVDWATDILFHLVYGYVTVAVFEALADD